jgi:hypothetical protein
MSEDRRIEPAEAPRTTVALGTPASVEEPRRSCATSVPTVIAAM